MSRPKSSFLVAIATAVAAQALVAPPRLAAAAEALFTANPQVSLPSFPQPPDDRVHAVIERGKREAQKTGQAIDRENRDGAAAAEDAAKRKNYEFPVLRIGRTYLNVPELIVTTGSEPVHVNVPTIRMIERRISYNVHDLMGRDVDQFYNMPEIRMEYRRFPWGGGMHVPVIDTRRERIVVTMPGFRTRTEQIALHLPEITTERALLHIPTLAIEWRTRRGFLDLPWIDVPSNVEAKQDARNTAEHLAVNDPQRRTSVAQEIEARTQSELEGIADEYGSRINEWKRNAVGAADTWYAQAEEAVSTFGKRLYELQATAPGAHLSDGGAILNATKAQIDEMRKALLERIKQAADAGFAWADALRTADEGH